MKDENQMSFNIVKNHPTERKYIIVKPLGNTLGDALRRLLLRR